MGYFNNDSTNPPEPPPQIRECDVHVLLEGDYTPRHVRYCNSCHAWMCDSCRKSPWRRAQAAAIRLVGG